MIGLVLVTHGDLALEFKLALEHVVGQQPNLSCVCIAADDDVESRRDDLLSAVAEVSDGDGVVILTDMFGGTPSNLAISVMEAGKVEVLAGINLPMLVKLAKLRDSEPMMTALDMACEAGRKYITVPSKML
ncbi:MAG: PTS sugar transporter subunit IIA [Pseudomonadota bacterium]